MDEIAKIQVDWMEEFSKEYPKLANNARDITSDSDNLYNTSYETYLKGELLTYSEKLLKLKSASTVKPHAKAMKTIPAHIWKNIRNNI